MFVVSLFLDRFFVMHLSPTLSTDDRWPPYQPSEHFLNISIKMCTHKTQILGGYPFFYTLFDGYILKILLMITTKCKKII